eukprot:TRINITY_DN6617_c0_g1_i1.p1 TRINITY_DN6617_c0_g1~~TRINITY_DN6617_c0_g1_i1.p1  ORF type:complete len:449 (-),score=86.48 TRINITY_DN6617_c0_g1_i1:30-1376(-)
MFYEDDEMNDRSTRKMEDEDAGIEEDDSGEHLDLPGAISPSMRPGTASTAQRAAIRAAKAKQLKDRMRKDRSSSMVMASESPRPSSAAVRSPSISMSSSPSGSPMLRETSRSSSFSDPYSSDGSPAPSPLLLSSSSSSALTSGVPVSPLSSTPPTHPAPLSDSERELIKRGITPTFDPTASRPLRPVIDLTDMHEFVIRPPPKGGMVQCRIVREKSGLDRLYPHYSLFLEESNTFLMAARKRKKSKSSNYLMSLARGASSRDSTSFIGKVRSNFVGTEFIVYDDGDAPDPSTEEPGEPTSSTNTIRQELASVIYSSNILGFKGPRKMTVLIPALKDDSTRVVWRPTTPAATLTERHKAGNLSGMVVLQNKAPVWNEQTQSYVLNFHNRVRQASVKNFQLVHPDDLDYIIMQFGRVAEDAFTMDFQYPMCLLQAFGIALSSFDNKLACE